jgi:hypothetical protein
VDELALLQPTPGYMRVVKDRVLYVWEQECASAKERTAEQERRLKTAVTAPLFRYLEPDERAEENLASLMPASWNQITTTSPQ